MKKWERIAGVIFAVLALMAPALAVNSYHSARAAAYRAALRRLTGAVVRLNARLPAALVSGTIPRMEDVEAARETLWAVKA